MPRGDKAKYTDKQERKADHIAESYEKRGISRKRPNGGMGDSEQGRRRRQEIRLRPWRAYRSSGSPQGRENRRQGIRFEISR